MSSDKHRNSRRVALWHLYAMDVTGAPAQLVLFTSRALVAEQMPGYDGIADEVTRRVFGVADKLDEVNRELQIISPRWKVERMAVIDRNILRLGVWEILQREVTPIITINACIELGKEYGDRSTPAFVNGLLDQLCRNHKIPIT